MRRKMLVYPLMGLTFLGCMWLIFSPSQEDREKERQGQGFNTDMPQPENAGIIGDKAKAYEQQQLEKRQKQRRGRNAPKGNGEPATYGHPLLGCRQQAAEHLAGHVLRAAEGG